MEKSARNKELTVNQKLIVNMLSSFFAYAVSFGISFFLSPYIVSTVGVEAYGFVNLANNFISYASLLAIALNALASRFITVSVHAKDYESANKYFTSVLFGNAFISVVLLLVLSVVWFYLEQLIQIPIQILWDVKILFGVLFLNCIISTVGSVFATATFATNKLYLESLRLVEANVARAVILIVLFAFFDPRVWYLGVTSLATTLYGLAYNICYTRKLLPAIKINRKHFDFKAVKFLISSGIWSLITRLGNLLIDGLDLLVTNIFIDATAMGVLSLAKTIPTMITSIIGSLVTAFSPNFTILYAQNEKVKLVAAVKQSMKIMGLLANLPIIVLIVCGKDFFSLWQPTQNAEQLQILSILTVACLMISGSINCIYDIFTVVNKLKLNSIMVLVGGFISTLIMLVLLETTNLGLYAVAGTSTVISILRNLLFTAPYGAKCLNLKWYALYPWVFKPVLCALLSIVICGCITNSILGEGWLHLVLCSAVTVGVSALIGIFIVLGKDDRRYLLNKLVRNKNN